MVVSVLATEHSLGSIFVLVWMTVLYSRDVVLSDAKVDTGAFCDMDMCSN